MVPQNFVFPSCEAQKMWNIWHFGITAQGIGPLKNLRKKYRSDIIANKRHFIDKAGLVMDSITEIARKKLILYFIFEII